MSSEAIGYGFRFSPYRGAAFAVHLAIADAVSDMHDNELFMYQANLARKARVGRQAVNDILGRMVGDGHLGHLAGGRGGLVRYRLLMPDVEPVYLTRGLVVVGDKGVATGDTNMSPGASGDVAVGDTDPKGTSTRSQLTRRGRRSDREILEAISDQR